MRSLLALLAATLLVAGASACGGSSTGADSTRSSAATPAITTAATGTAKPYSGETVIPSARETDRDKDNDAGPFERAGDNNAVLHYGHRASAADERAIKALVKRYYAAAFANDGATACSLMYSVTVEAVPEDYGQSPPAPAYMRGTTCPAVMTLFFKHEHGRLAVMLPKLKITRVRVEEHQGLVVLSFGKLPERQIKVIREGHPWKLHALLDTELP